MGGGAWSDDSYRHIKSTNKNKTTNQIFTSTSLKQSLSPKNVKFRESRDSNEHPESLAVSVYLDVTGSMGRIPEVMVREKLGALMSTIIKHDVKHPQILFGAIGDHLTDTTPLQVGQFESETNLIDTCLTDIYLEGNGGGQRRESYLLAYLFAGRHTSMDCFEKRQQKGFLFTIGDEATWEELSADSLKEIMGYEEAETVSVEQLLAEAKRMCHVFHIHINEGNYKNDSGIISSWKKLLGERFIILEDYTAIAETIASTIAVIHGVDLKDVISGFDKTTAQLVSNALVNINDKAVQRVDKNTGGIVTL